MLAPILGPVVGGAILQNLHWSWIFLVNVPIGVVAFIACWRTLPETESGEAGRLDVLGPALFGAMILVPLYYQEVRHESVIVTGLLTGPQGLGVLMVMPLSGRLSERLGGGRVALAGVAILVLATIPLAFVDASSSILAISLVLVARGIGIGFSFMPAMTAAFASLRTDQLSDATPQMNVLQRVRR